MKLTTTQKGFLDNVCGGRKGWTLNKNGEIDVPHTVWCDDVLRMFNVKSLEEFGIQFGEVRGDFRICNNNLTSLNGTPRKLINQYKDTEFYFGDHDPIIYTSGNNLTDYFKSIKEDEFPLWENLHWGAVSEEYPFLINIGKKYMDRDDLKYILRDYPSTKLYFK